MRPRIPWLVLIVFFLYGCATTRPAPAPSETLEGVASWYGQEFSGRTTANGEIFDPMLLTAAHRTLPFGTVVDVTNPKTSQTVRVRVNDRGPYVGNRVIDLSYAAARQIGLVEPGIGDVKITIVRLGRGDREPPAPFVVSMDPPAKTEEPVKAGDPPSVAFPLPGQAKAPASGRLPTSEIVVDSVEVREQRGGTVTRRQVGADGLTIENVPVEGAAAAPSMATRAPAPAAPARSSSPAPAVSQGRRVFVQVGAFSSEANAKALQARLAEIGHTAIVDHHELYRVRIGPFATRDEALRVRATLEEKGISAIIATE